MLRQGITLLTRFCQDDRVRISQPQRNLQIKFTPLITGSNEFVANIDAIGKLDGQHCLLEWKTSSSRYPEEPEGLLALDPQLVCYSWITGSAEVAQVVFVRKSLVEVQYLRTTIDRGTAPGVWSLGGRHNSPYRVGRLSAPQWHPLSPEPCNTCPYVGLCPGKQEMIDAALVRRPGADSLGWLDKLNY